jgi:monovalent cation/hydrogen antiporter
VTAFCEHFNPEITVDAPLRVCSVCVASGGTWVHLRQCLTCGLTACCDLSPNRHATAHFRETGHPMIRSAEVHESWWWCYEDDRLYPVEPAAAETAAT